MVGVVAASTTTLQGRYPNRHDNPFEIERPQVCTRLSCWRRSDARQMTGSPEYGPLVAWWWGQADIKLPASKWLMWPSWRRTLLFHDHFSANLETATACRLTECKVRTATFPRHSDDIARRVQ